MSWQATTWVVEHSRHKGSSFVLLLMIANHAHSDGTGSYASLDTLARESRIHVRHVIRLIPKLVRSGELRAEKHAGPNGSTLYSLPGMTSAVPQMSENDNLSRDIRGPQMSPEYKEKKEKKERKETAPPALPVDVPLSTWSSFVEMRRGLRKPLTPRAVDLILQKLQVLKAQGHSPREVLEQSVMNSWAGVFPIKGGNGNGRTTAEQRTQRNLTALGFHA